MTVHRTNVVAWAAQLARKFLVIIDEKNLYSFVYFLFFSLHTQAKIARRTTIVWTYVIVASAVCAHADHAKRAMRQASVCRHATIRTAAWRRLAIVKAT